MEIQKQIIFNEINTLILLIENEKEYENSKELKKTFLVYLKNVNETKDYKYVLYELRKFINHFIPHTAAYNVAVCLKTLLNKFEYNKLNWID